MALKTKNTKPGCAFVYVSGKGQPNEHFYERKISINTGGPAQYMLETSNSDTIYVTLSSNCDSESSVSGDTISWDTARPCAAGDTCAGNGALISSMTVPIGASLPSALAAQDCGMSHKIFTLADNTQVQGMSHELRYATDGIKRPDCHKYFKFHESEDTANFYFQRLELVSYVKIWPVYKTDCSASNGCDAMDLADMTVYACEDSDLSQNVVTATSPVYDGSWFADNPFEPLIFYFINNARANYIKIDTSGMVGLEIAEIEAFRPTEGLSDVYECQVQAEFKMMEDLTNLPANSGPEILENLDTFMTDDAVEIDLTNSGSCEESSRREIKIVPVNERFCHNLNGTEINHLVHVTCPIGSAQSDSGTATNHDGKVVIKVTSGALENSYYINCHDTLETHKINPDTPPKGVPSEYLKLTTDQIDYPFKVQEKTCNCSSFDNFVPRRVDFLLQNSNTDSLINGITVEIFSSGSFGSHDKVGIDIECGWEESMTCIGCGFSDTCVGGNAATGTAGRTGISDQCGGINCACLKTGEEMMDLAYLGLHYWVIHYISLYILPFVYISMCCCCCVAVKNKISPGIEEQLILAEKSKNVDDLRLAVDNLVRHIADTKQDSNAGTNSNPLLIKYQKTLDEWEFAENRLTELVGMNDFKMAKSCLFDIKTTGLISEKISICENSLNKLSGGNLVKFERLDEALKLKNVELLETLLNAVENSMTQIVDKSELKVYYDGLHQLKLEQALSTRNVDMMDNCLSRIAPSEINNSAFYKPYAHQLKVWKEQDEQLNKLFRKNEFEKCADLLQSFETNFGLVQSAERGSIENNLKRVRENQKELCASTMKSDTLKLMNLEEINARYETMNNCSHRFVGPELKECLLKLDSHKLVLGKREDAMNKIKRIKETYSAAKGTPSVRSLMKIHAKDISDVMQFARMDDLLELPDEFSEIASEMLMFDKKDNKKRECMNNMKRIKDELHEANVMEQDDKLQLVIVEANDCLESIYSYSDNEEDLPEIEDFERAIRAAKKRRMSIKIRAVGRFQRAAVLKQQGVEEDEMRSKLMNLVAEKKMTELEAMLEDATSVLGADDKDVLKAARCLGEGKLNGLLNDLEKCAKDSLKTKTTDRLKSLVQEASQFAVTYSLTGDARLIQVREDMRKLIAHLTEVELCEKYIQQLNRGKVAEIVSYGTPPALVYTIIRSLLYLLGENKQTCKDWKKMRVIFKKTGEEGIQNRIANFDPTTDIKKSGNENI